MSDDILDRIRCAAFEFHKYNQLQPTSVYLGHKEYAGNSSYGRLFIVGCWAQH